MFFKHLLFRLNVLFFVATRRPDVVVEHLNCLLREARKLRRRQWAIPFLETQKLNAQKRINAAIQLNHHSA